MRAKGQVALPPPCCLWHQNLKFCGPGIEHCDWSILLLPLPLPLPTLTMQFSLDRKQRNHRQNQCSASDSVGLIFAGSYDSDYDSVTNENQPSGIKDLVC